MTQAIERLSLKIDDQNLVNGTYQSEHNRQSYQPPPHRSPPHQPPLYRLPLYWPPLHQPPIRYSLQHPQFTEILYEEKS